MAVFITSVIGSSILTNAVKIGLAEITSLLLKSLAVSEENPIFLTISKTQDDNAQISILYNFNNINDLATRAEDEWL